MKRVTLSIALLITALALKAAVPQLISYQGTLVNTAGFPLDTTVTMTFNLYTDSLAGSLLWTETQPGIGVANGRFDAQLGRFTSLTDAILGNPQVWLGVQIGGDTEMTPRAHVVSVGYAYRVGSVDGASGGTISSNVSIINKLNVGSGNINSGNFSNALGESGVASGDHAVIGGGGNNRARGIYATVSGGGGALPADSNGARGSYSTVSGGRQNRADTTYATSSGGFGNLASGYGATAGGGQYNFARGTFATIAGGGNIVLSDSNSARGSFSVIAGGRQNRSDSVYTAVGGGFGNLAGGFGATVGGGQYNRARGDYSVIGGGGAANLADSNFTGDNGATVAGGIGNHAVMEHSTVGGGLRNRAAELGATVGGGVDNSAGNAATVAGGDSNTAAGIVAFVGGGRFNVASDFAATVSGGLDNQATSFYATIGGGNGNRVTAGDATVGGGISNLAAGSFSTIAGGRYNRTRGLYSAIVGGGGASETDSNSARGDASTILGGRRNETAGIFSLAAGYRAKANHAGSFVWADSTGADFASTAADQFNVRASGGINMWTNAAATVGVTLLASDNTWNSICDSTLKTRIERVDGQTMLDKLAQLPVYRWYHRAGDPHLQHIGPMAQDFWNQFHVGGDSLKISTIDPAGIALAAIQELAEQNRELRAQAETDRRELQELKARLDQLAPEQLGAVTK